MGTIFVEGNRYLIWDGYDPMSLEEIEIVEKSERALKVRRHGKNFGQIFWEDRENFKNKYEIYEDLGPSMKNFKIGMTD